MYKKTYISPETKEVVLNYSSSLLTISGGVNGDVSVGYGGEQTSGSADARIFFWDFDEE